MQTVTAGWGDNQDEIYFSYPVLKIEGDWVITETCKVNKATFVVIPKNDCVAFFARWVRVE